VISGWQPQASGAPPPLLSPALGACLRRRARQVGAGRTFDPTTYSANIAANRQQQAESTKRSFVGSGDILAFPATPGSGTAAAKQP
jgi:hypothetical protein